MQYSPALVIAGAPVLPQGYSSSRNRNIQPESLKEFLSSESESPHIPAGYSISHGPMQPSPTQMNMLSQDSILPEFPETLSGSSQTPNNNNNFFYDMMSYDAAEEETGHRISKRSVHRNTKGCRPGERMGDLYDQMENENEGLGVPGCGCLTVKLPTYGKAACYILVICINFKHGFSHSLVRSLL